MSKYAIYWIIIIFMFIIMIPLRNSPFAMIPAFIALFLVGLAESERKAAHKEQNRQKQEANPTISNIPPKEYKGKHAKASSSSQSSSVNHDPVSHKPTASDKTSTPNTNHIVPKSNPIKHEPAFGKTATPIIPTASKAHQTTAFSTDNGYIQYIMSNFPTATREDVENFMLVLDVYETTKSKERTLRAFDMFMNNIISTDPMHAFMVNGFFCGLLGTNLSLSDNEIDALPKKYNPLIIARLNNK